MTAAGRLFLIVGPSGVGKDTLLAGATAADPSLHWARRVITRPVTAGGEPFEGVSAPEFRQRLEAGEFALHWQAHGLSYGVPWAEIAPLTTGRTVLVNGSRRALSASLTAFPDLTVIRITAPSAVLAERLAARGRETQDQIAARLDDASYQLPEGTRVIDVRNTGTPLQGTTQLLQALRGFVTPL
jgi:phosphonate metabolism protein PhnN/1,5-bisphosphokinase (PRPP-forming)